MILKMILEGFRQYKRKQHISFSSGLNLIQGTNDAGKSTIFYALEYALFGSVQGFQGLQPLKNWDRTVNKIWVQIEYLSKDNKQFKLTRWHMEKIVYSFIRMARVFPHDINPQFS